MYVGGRELKLHLGEYLKRVRGGETVTVTARGKPVARLQPVQTPPTPPTELRHLVEAGRLVWMPPLRGYRPTIQMLPGEKSSTDFVREQRR